VGIARDITEQKQAEEALRSALERERELHELKTRFVSMTSHEFRTPLAIIQASLDLIQRYGDRMSGSGRTEHYTRIQEQIYHMTALLNDVLLVGRFDAGHMPFTPTPLDLCHFCRRLADDMSGEATTHRIVHTCTGGPFIVNADSKLLRQSITNLLSNAAKYSPDGGEIHVLLEREGHQAVVRIHDEGIGIPEADLPRLFEPFHRAGNVGEIGGTGLGLVIAKRAVELHGGSISVESTPGAGTTFTVRLPLSDAPP
jgi:signal transduction histidine kinase